MDKDRLEKLLAKFEADLTKNGKVITLLPFITEKFGDILKDAKSPPSDQDVAMTKYIARESAVVMWWLQKRSLLELTIFINEKVLSKKFKVSEVDDMRTFLQTTLAQNTWK